MSKFDPYTFVTLGNKIADMENNEAGYRTAISRVYYTCHLIGRESTVKKGWFNPRNSREDHSGLCEALKKQGRNDLASKLRDICELREHADYHTELNKAKCKTCSDSNSDLLVTSEHWEQAKAISDNIYSRLESISPKTSR